MFEKTVKFLTIILAITLISSLSFYASLDVSAQTIITKSGGASATPTAAPTAVQPPFTDTNTLIAGSSDATKLMRFEIDGYTTGTTRVVTPPNSNLTLAGIDIANTFTQTNTFNGSTTFGAGVNNVMGSDMSFVSASTTAGITWNRSTITPISMQMLMGSASNSLHLVEIGDAAFDFNNGSCGTLICADPSLIIHSHNQIVAQYLQLSHNGTNAVIATGTGGLILPGAIHTAGTVPAVSNTTANSCGTTTATIAGTDATGKIVVGATSGTSCTITFNVAAPTRRQCWASDETTAVLTRFVYLTTTTGKVDGVFTAGDTLEYGCLTY